MASLTFRTRSPADSRQQGSRAAARPSLLSRLYDAIRRDRQRQADVIAATYHCDRWSDTIETDMTRVR